MSRAKNLLVCDRSNEARLYEPELLRLRRWKVKAALPVPGVSSTIFAAKAAIADGLIEHCELT